MGDLVDDLGRQALPIGEKNIAFRRESDGYRARGVVPIDSDGVAIGSDLRDYKLYKKDDDESPHYFGKENSNGAWYILRETISAGDDTYAWTKGDSDIVTNWTNRVSLSYGTYSAIF